MPVELATAMVAGSDMMAIGAPLVVRDEPFGALALVAHRFDASDRGLTELFAEQASVILDYSGTRHELERLLLIEERERIGRICTTPSSNGCSRPVLNCRRLRYASRRPTTIFALQSPGLGASSTAEGARIHEHVVDIVDESSRALGFEPDVLFSGDPTARVPADIAEHMLVVVHEALTNVARHAHATHAKMTIEVGNEVVARVADNGVGPAAAGREGGGYGLANMRERARSVGGHLDVSARRDGGTVLEWRVVLRQP